MTKLFSLSSKTGTITLLSAACLLAGAPARGELVDLDKVEALQTRSSRQAAGTASSQRESQDLNNDVAKILDRAIKKREAGDKAGALKDLDYVIQMKPTAYAYFQRAYTLNECKDWKGAENDYSQSLQLKPDHDAYHNRGLVRLQLKDENGALEDFNEAIRLDPKDGIHYYVRATTRRDRGDLKGAMDDLDTAARLCPNYEDVFSARAFIKRQQKDHRGCLEDLNQAVRINPNNPDNWFQRAYTKDDLGDKHGAVEDLNEAIRLRPDYPEAYRNRYVARRDIGDKNNSDWEIFTNLSLKPRTATDYWNWAWAKSKIGNYREALNGWNEYFRLKRSTPNPAVYLNRGECLSVLGDSSGAIADFTEAINLKPGFAEAYNGRAMERIELKDYAGAMEDATKAISLDAKNAAPYFDTRAWAKLKAGDKAGALSDLNEAIRLNPKLPEAISKRALIKAELGDTGAANFDLATCANLAPDNGSVLRFTAAARRTMGDTKGAVADLTNAAKCLKRDGRIAEHAKLVNENPWHFVSSQIASTPPPPAATTTATSMPTASLTTAASNQPATSTQASSTQAQTAPDRSDVSGPSRPVTDKWALVVGISKFESRQSGPTVPALKYAAKDATDFYNFLIDKANFKRDHIRLLLDEKATREQILTELGSKFLPRVAEKDDLVVVYFSTHGSSGTNDISGASYVISYDSKLENLYPSAIEMQQIMDGIMKKRVRSDRVLLIMDTCFSGAADPYGKGAIVGNVDAEAIAQTTGQVVISSSSRNQRSWESHQYPNGVFTRKFIDVFTRFGASQPLSKVFPYVQKAVENEVRQDEGLSQTPMLSPAHGDNNLILGAIPTEPEPISPKLLKELGPDSSNAARAEWTSKMAR